MHHVIPSEACIKPAMRYLPVATILLRGPEFIVEEINQAALNLLQVEKTVIGLKILDLLPDLAEQSAYLGLRHVYQSKRSYYETHSDGFLKIQNATWVTQFSYQFVDYDEILLVLHPLNNVRILEVEPVDRNFATAVVALAGLGTFDFDLIGKSFRSSKRFAEIFGFDSVVPFEEYMSRIHPDDHAVRDKARLDVQEGRELHYEVRVVMPDQSTRWVRINAKPFFDDRDHQQHRWIGSAADITKEKRAFEELQENEARFRTLITETPEVASALYVGPDIRVQYVNQVMLKFWGKDESVTGKTFLDALPETANQPFYDQLVEVYSTGITYTAKEQKATLEIHGEVIPRYYNYTFKALRNPGGEIYGIHHMAIDVTDQVTAKQLLVQREESVKQLFMQTPVGIGMLKGESLIIELVNDAMLAYWKRTREEVIDRPLWEVFPEIASQGFAAITKRVFETGEPYYSPETPVEMLRNGQLEMLYVHFAFEPVRDNHGNVSGMLTIGNDVTDLVVARKKSELNEARLQNLADSMPQLVWIANDEGHVTYYNNQVRNFDGVTRAKDGIWEWRAIVHPDDLVRTREAWTTAVNEKTTYAIEHRVKMKDGTFRWHLSRAIPQWDHEGKITWYGTATDIQQVRDAAMAVRESEERFRIMADATPGIIWALTPEGIHRYLNRYALDYLGIHREEVSALRWDMHIHPDEIQSTQRILGEAIKNRTPYSHEHRLRRHDGEYRWFLSQGAPSYYSNGELYGFVGSGTEIHEWKLAQELLRKNEEMLENLVKERTLELQRSNNDLQQFAHVASHDLKEPIRKIKIFSYKLQDEFGSVLNERGNGLLDKIIHSIDRMFAMINGVLNYSTVAAVKNSIEEVDLNKIVQAVQTDLEILIAEKNATIDYGVLPKVHANADLIHQLFYNLINNSLKFSKPNESSEIKIRSREGDLSQNGFVEIAIEDNGIGFDSEFAEGIFGSFVRLHSKDQYEGSGLGLALCKRIVERYGGVITAEAQEGIGSTFKFTLPA